MCTRTLQGTLLILLISLSPTLLHAQSGDAGTTVTVSLFIIVGLVVLSAVMLVGDNLLGLEGKSRGVDVDGASTEGGLSRLFTPKPPAYTNGSYTQVKKGYNINLKGSAEARVESKIPSTVALQPRNFEGMSPIPKLLAEVGEEVAAGDHLFFDKKRPEIKYVAPVSGEVVAVNRGEKRSIVEVVILVDGEQRYREMPELSSEANREEIVNWLLDTGGWTLLKQRPYDVVPDPQVIPANIFISTFDTAPLAPDLNLVVQGNESDFNTGLALLKRLTEGAVHLGLDGRGENPPPAVFSKADAEKHYFSGAHPIGNVGVQMHHIKPVSNKNIAWVLGVQEVITLGKLVSERRYDGSRTVVLSGEGVAAPHYVRTYQGAKMSDLLNDNVIDGDLRTISGDVLSGERKSADGYLNFLDDQITVIPEGQEYELFGWLLPLKARPSVSRTFPNFLFPDTALSATTNTHGEERAFVMTGQYEDMLPMDLYPQHLMKAILARDFERMEGLGIYELSEEDLALCEFACTSKQPLQEILREGLNFMREQG